MVSNRLVSVRHMAGASLANVFYLTVHSLLFLLLTPWMLSVLGQERYGLWTIMLAVVGFAGLANFGVATTTIKFTAEFSTSDENSEKFSASITFSYLLMLVTGVLASLVLLLLSDWIATRVDSDPGMSFLFAMALRWVAIGIMPLFLSQASKGVLLGLVYNGLAGGITLALDALLWIGALAIGMRGEGIHFLGMWTLIINLLRFFTMTCTAWLVTRPFDLHFIWDMPLFRRMLNYSMFTWIGSLGAVAFQSLDRIMVGMVLGASAAGTYAVASGIATRLYMLVSQFTQVLTPFASSYQEDSSQAQIQTAFRLSSRWGACILVMTASVLVMWMDTILNIWISPQFSEQYASLFRIMVIAYAVYSMAAPAYRIVVGLGWLKVPTAIMIVSGSCTLFMLWILTRNIGLVGAAYANFVYCIVLLINYYTAHRLGLKALAVVLADLGPPLIVLFLVVLVLNGNPTVEVRLSINIIVMAVISWMALSGRRAQLFLNAVRRQ